MAPNELESLLALLRNRKPEPGETGVQRISWAYGQVALSAGVLTIDDQERLRRLAEQAVCARYEEENALLRSQREEARREVAQMVNVGRNTTEACSAEWETCWCDTCQARRKRRADGDPT